MAEGDTVVNALLGAVVSIVLSPLMFSPVLGGLLAGYLEGGDRSDGLRVGAISGVVALVPLLGFLLIVGAALGFFLIGGDLIGVGIAGFVLGLFAFAFIAVLVVGLSALGGWLGNYLKTDTEFGGRRSTFEG